MQLLSCVLLDLGWAHDGSSTPLPVQIVGLCAANAMVQRLAGTRSWRGMYRLIDAFSLFSLSASRSSSTNHPTGCPPR